MKRIYTTSQFKRKHKRRLQKLQRIREFAKKRLYIPETYYLGTPKGNVFEKIKPLIAPFDFRLIDNTEACLSFFRDLRNINIYKHKNNKKFINISLKHVEFIDYGTISILTAISDELVEKGVNLKGDFPDEKDCKTFIQESGFLNKMYDSKTGKPFQKSAKSELIFFEKGKGKLSVKENINISNAIKNVVKHLTQEYKQGNPIKTIILEICGNSIEWSGTLYKQWLLGVKYEQDKVIFTVTDIGKGILDTLYRKFGTKLKELFVIDRDKRILNGAFDRKYGSTTQEENRNKGLPSIKALHEKGIILNLKVLTNTVILHFGDEQDSRVFKKGEARFKGTFYQWEMTKQSIENIII